MIGLYSYRKHLSDRNVSYGEEEDCFTYTEKASIILLLIAFIIPTSFFSDRFIFTEIAMILFVAVQKRNSFSFLGCFLLMLVLIVPLFFGLIFTERNTSKLTMIFVYSKISIFSVFIQAFVSRCKTYENAKWVALRFILIVSCVLCFSALIDRYSDTNFFVNWHKRFTLGTNSSLQRILNDYGDDVTTDEIADELLGSGFAIRTMDIPPWALLGLVTAYWLKQQNSLKTLTFSIISIILVGSAFSMPKRSAVIDLAIALLAFIFIEYNQGARKWKILLPSLLIGAAILSNIVGLAYQVGRSGAISSDNSVSLSRLLNLGLLDGGDEHRYIFFVEQLNEFKTNPRLLLLGSGWDFGAGVWVAPHNTYTAIVVGGGLVSFIALIIAIYGLFRRSEINARRMYFSRLGLILLAPMLVEIGVNGYLTYHLSFPTSTLVIWIAWSAVLHHSPRTVSI